MAITLQPPIGSTNNNTDDRSLAGPQISHRLDFAGKMPAKAKADPCQIARTTITSFPEGVELATRKAYLRYTCRSLGTGTVAG
jgi:hypothetical protein